jgi:predicted Zn-dependent protease
MQDDTFYTEILNWLESQGGEITELYGWSVSISRKISEQRLMYSDESNGLHPNTIRHDISDTSYSVSVFTRQGDPVVMGRADSKLDPSLPLESQLPALIENALVVANEPWDLVTPAGSGEPIDVKTTDPLLVDDQSAAIDDLVLRADSACRSLEKVSVNYAELFTHVQHSFKTTSTGITIPSSSSGIYFEIAMEKLPLPNTQEVHNHTSSLTIEGLDIENFIEETAEEVRSLGEIVMPDTDENAVLLVNAEVITDILHCLTGQVDASREYIRQPHLAVGDSVFSGEAASDADPITISVDPGIDFMAESRSMTGEGIVPKSGTLVKNNRVEQQVVSNRIAQYLSKPVNPLYGNLVVVAGGSSYEELLKSAPVVIEVLRFSSLLMNGNQLTFSSEIKLAKEHNNETGTVRLLKGGVVSGDIRQCLATVKLSRETTSVNTIAGSFNPATGYDGPKWMLLRSGISISGS